MTELIPPGMDAEKGDDIVAATSFMWKLKQNRLSNYQNMKIMFSQEQKEMWSK